MLVTGAQWAEVVSFDDRLKDLELVRYRVDRDDKAIALYEEVALQFLDEVQRDYDVMAAMRVAV